MSSIDAALAANREATNYLLATAERCGPGWATPRAPGKWSPAQVVEHVARSYEESAFAVSGTSSKFPSLPAPVRFMARNFFFKRVVKTGKFLKGRTTKSFDPIAGPDTPAAARTRMDAAVGRFEAACRARAVSHQDFYSSVFGTISVGDYIKFQEMHTRHHCSQIPSA